MPTIRPLIPGKPMSMRNGRWIGATMVPLEKPDEAQRRAAKRRQQKQSRRKNRR